MKKYFVTLLILLAFQLCFSQTYYVDPTDPLNYNTIQSAIDTAISNGGSATVIVYNPNTNGDPYTYQENVIINFQINNNLSSILLNKNYEQGEVIISSPSTTNYTIQITGRVDTPNMTIDGFTIRDGSYGIRVADMYNYSTYINNCIITENYCDGIYAEDTILNINYCTITENDYNGMHEVWNSAVQRQIGYVMNSEISNNGTNGLDLESYWDIINCTIVNNGEKGLYGYRQFDITSSIIRGNTIQIDLNNYYEVKYSNIQGGFTGIGNIDADPLFVDPLNDDYNLTQLSTCIDAGDPTLPLDPDNTVTDMGCYYFYHDYDIKRFEEGIQWVSFPYLTQQGTFNGDMYEQAYYGNSEPGLLQLTSNGAPTINDFLEIEGKNKYILYSSLFGFNDGGFGNKLFRHEGYKVEVDEYGDPTTLIVDGDRLTSYELDMSTTENYWLGYYVPYPQNIEDAFGDDFYKVNKVWAEDWYYDAHYIQRGGDPTQLSSNSTKGKTMEYGKMYIVNMYHDVDNFSWNGSNTAEEPEKKAPPENFSYTEKMDYEVIDVVSIPGYVTEIGVFEDDICVGAIAVEDSSEQILVYSDNANRDPVPFTFEVVTGRGESSPFKDYLVLNPMTGEFESSVIISGRQGYSAIKFGELEEPANTVSIPVLNGNYPNPFNPTTTISFSLPTEQDIELIVYNIKGQKVKTLYSGFADIGEHTITWSGKDSNDKQVSSGLYFYKLKTNNNTLTRKMIMIK